VELYTLNISTHKKSEVDLRVAQELKNNQDFIYQTNQSLQDLKKVLDALLLQHRQLIEKSCSDRKDLEIRFEKLENDVLKNIKQCLSKVNEMDDSVNRLTVSKDRELKRLNEQVLVITEHLLQQDQINLKWEKMQKEIEDLHDRLDQDIFSVKSSIHLQTSSLREDLCKQIPKIDLTKEQLEDRLETVYVDFAGLVRELELLKKSTNYNEKKFENIYTLIKRLQEGKECHKPAQ
jgi:hypothetical protein